MAPIVLVNPPVPGKSPALLIPSLGLGYLAAALRQAGLEVRLIDALALGLDEESVVREVVRLKPELVGLTATTPLSTSAYRLVRRLRPHARWLMLGGAHASAVGAEVFTQCPELDYAFRGEAEEAFPEFVKGLLAGDKRLELPGVMSPGRVCEPARAADLDRLAFPAWDLMPMERYRHPLFPGERVATVFSSRGCPYQCVFCDKSVCGSAFRPRSPENVLRELEDLHDRHGVTAFMFYDDLFTLDQARVLKLCRLLEARGLRLRWKCEGRVNIVDDQILDAMERAGCVQVAYGIETAHQKGLDWLRKGVTVEQVRRAVARTRAAGLQVLGYFIVGLPVEDEADVMRSVEFAVELGLDYAQFASLSPFPNTPLHDLAKAKGWYREAPGPAPEEYGETRPLLVTDYWSEARLKSVLRRAYRRFYLRPGYLLRAALRPRGFWALAKSGLGLLRWLGRG